MEEERVYDIFHDENKDDGFWHSFIFIPRDKNRFLLELLLEARKNLNYYYPIHFTNIKSKTSSNSVIVRLVRSWITILYYAIQQQKISADLDLGVNSNRPITRKIKGLDKKIGARFVTLRERDNLKSMYDTMSYSRKVETTLRMGLKGGSHFLFKNENIRIGNIYVDHPPKNFEKNYNKYNIIGKFQNEAKENISFESNTDIIPIDKREYKQKEMISEFMQLADVAVGAIRARKLKILNPRTRFDISYPFQELLDKEINIKKRMENSRFKNAFSLSDAWIENGSWCFDQMQSDKYSCDDEPMLF